MCTALITNKESIERVCDRVAKNLGYESFKSDQETIVSGLLEDRDVFAILPTGYRKSLCYACLPWVYDEIFRNLSHNESNSIVIIVTPLIAIMKDQVN